MDDALSTARDLFRAGLTQLSAGDDSAAEATFRRVDALVPGDPAVLHKLGDLALRRRDYATAEDFYRQAHEKVPSSPGYRMIYGHQRLFRGDYAGGFPLFDAWRERPEAAGRGAVLDPAIPRWTGQPAAGKRILVWSEEGYGDQIMYARFAAELISRGAEVVWGAFPPLVRLLSEAFDMEVFPIGIAESAPGVIDYVITSSALPAVLMPELKTPPPAPYLKTPPPRTPPGARIGLKLKGDPGHSNDARRSLSDDDAERLLSLPGAIDLSPEATGARDFHDTAAIIAGLDRVITVDTSVAHLAGAMGAAVSILLPATGLDWRWGRESDTTPWYGSARLVRQKTPGDWNGAIDEVLAQAGI
jgi:tetratricopeptide (TPR) repeat protein